MPIVRWDPFREVMSLQREMNRLFDDISMNNSMSNGQEGSTPRSMGMMPLAEMEEKDNKIHLKLEMPGMNADDLDIRVMREAVMISGERKSESTSEQNGQKRSEFHYGSFSRTIPLPEPVDNDNVQAEYKDGILMLELPKVEDHSNKAVKVSLNSGANQSGANRTIEQSQVNTESQTGS